MRHAALIAGMLALTACDFGTHSTQTATASAVGGDTPVAFPTYQSQAECEQAGGKWRAACIPNKPACLMPYRDGGHKCRNSSECEGRMCMADLTARCTPDGKCVEPAIPETGEPFVGICKRDDAPCGSFIEIKEGYAQPPSHVD